MNRYTAIGEKYNMCFKMMKSDSRLVKTLMFSYGFTQVSFYFFLIIIFSALQEIRILMFFGQTHTLGHIQCVH